jgi:hypothetical protein
MKTREEYPDATVYRAICASCLDVWEFWEHRGIAEDIVIPYVKPRVCQCGGHYGAVLVEYGDDAA